MVFCVPTANGVDQGGLYGFSTGLPPDVAGTNDWRALPSQTKPNTSSPA
jgi:hypothetical protein